jgi:hypothetical protein
MRNCVVSIWMMLKRKRLKGSDQGSSRTSRITRSPLCFLSGLTNTPTQRPKPFRRTDEEWGVNGRKEGREGDDRERCGDSNRGGGDERSVGEVTGFTSSSVPILNSASTTCTRRTSSSSSLPCCRPHHHHLIPKPHFILFLFILLHSSFLAPSPSPASSAPFIFPHPLSILLLLGRSHPLHLFPSRSPSSPLPFPHHGLR